MAIRSAILESKGCNLNMVFLSNEKHVFIFKDGLDWFGFFVFNGISTFVDYLMPKPFS